MTKHAAPLKYPRLIHHRRYCRNGRPVHNRFMARIGEANNHIVAYRRKIVAYGGPGEDNLQAGQSGTVPTWSYYFRSGHGSDIKLHFRFLCKHSGSGTDPYVAFTVTDVATTTAVATDQYHLQSTEPTPGLVTYSISADTLYTIDVSLVDYAEIIGLTVYETHPVEVDDTVTGVMDPRYSIGAQILDAEQAAAHDAMYALYQANSGGVACWTRTGDSTTAPTFATATYVNVIDGSSTIVTGATPGLSVQLTKRGHFEDTTVPCVVAVLAQRTVGGTISNGVRIADSGGTLATLTGWVGVLSWKTATLNLTDQDIQKIDILARGGSSETLRVDAVCIYQWEAAV